VLPLAARDALSAYFAGIFKGVDRAA